MVKQVIVIRKDLNMRKGKMIAQGAHASMKVILDMATEFTDKIVINLNPMLTEWLCGTFTKIVVAVDSEEELLDIAEKAKQSGIYYSLITDVGRTEFHGNPTHTAVAIGPDDEEKINKITGHLKLL